jgi:hypothetical protein
MLEQAQYPRAETLLRRAVAIYESGQPQNPVALGETLYHLGRVYAAQHKLAEARRTLGRAVQLLETKLDPADARVASARRDYEKLAGTLP